MRRNDFVEHEDEPIYRWVIEKDGRVTKLDPITKYKKSSFPKYDYYFFRIGDKPSTQCVRSSVFDTCTAKGVYSFNGDDSKAMSIIEDHLKARYDKAKTEFERAEKRWKGFKGEIG